MEGEKLSLYSRQSYDQLEILIPWRKERRDIGKELEDTNMGAWLGVKLLGGRVGIYPFIEGIAKAYSKVFVPEDRIWIYLFIRQVFIEYLLCSSIILRAGL